MNVYIWKHTAGVTTNWHSGGGLLIVAASLDRARALWVERNDAPNIADWERLSDPSLAVKPDPDHSLPTAPDASELVIVFPDAGCC